MGLAIQKVNAILAEQFPGMEVAIGTRKGVKRATGFIIWSGFAGKSQIDRQTLLWNTIEARLTRDEHLSLGTILTMTPQEVAAMDEVVAAA